MEGRGLLSGVDLELGGNANSVLVFATNRNPASRVISRPSEFRTILSVGTQYIGFDGYFFSKNVA